MEGRESSGRRTGGQTQLHCKKSTLVTSVDLFLLPLHSFPPVSDTTLALGRSWLLLISPASRLGYTGWGLTGLPLLEAQGLDLEFEEFVHTLLYQAVMFMVGGKS